MTSPLEAPLTDDEYGDLAEYLEAHSNFDIDGALGVLHAVAVAPGLVPPSSWMRLLVPDPADDPSGGVLLLLRLYNDVIASVERAQLPIPGEDDVAGCVSFASGYVAGAQLDPT